MKLYALDTVHVSSVKSDALVRGEEFETEDDVAKQLIDRGLASETAPSAKEAPPHKAKVEPALKTKST